MPHGKKRVLWVLLFVILFGAGIAGGYLFVSQRFSIQKREPAHAQPPVQAGNAAFVRIFYPLGDRLVMEERSVQRVPDAPIVEAVVKEYLRGPSQGKSVIPFGTKVLGVYRGSDGILYLDLSDEFRRNFQGDALTEFLVLKGLYDSIISNGEGIDDVKLLVEGKEIESVGGHLFALYPLRSTLQEARQP
ncbi:MAG TPA: GerMN domain-containing protein [Thermodesulfovibrionales bacterium]|nr:GerMN domain-containing protein [Thermodesulfovibrionales bacterium]